MISGTLEVSNPLTKQRWQKSLAQGELERIRGFLGEKKQPWKVSVLVGALFPVRTNSWSNFSRDFFLPTFVNHALKVDYAVLNIFLGFLAIVYDAVTFPLRVITCLPRVYLNYQKEEHPFLNYLKKEKIDALVWGDGRVKVQLNWTEKNKHPNPFHNAHSPEKCFYRKGVHFIDVPFYSEDVVSGSSSSSWSENPKKLCLIQ